MSDSSDNESFKSAQDGEDKVENTAGAESIEHFSHEEEAVRHLIHPSNEPLDRTDIYQLLLKESNELKTTANSQFITASFSSAIQSYDKALASCPAYLDYEIAVLRSNIAACHVKLAEWKEAVEAASKSLECLERIDPVPKQSVVEARNEDQRGLLDSGGGTAEEVDDDTAEKIEALQRSGHTRDEVQKIRLKALMRRAKSRMEVGGWSSLQGAEEDYKQLLGMRELSSLDRKTVDKAMRILPPRLEEAKQREMGEMMGKLKELGNGILKPFGLSTQNFNFVKDEATGGYSMQFNQGGKAGS